ncbi:MAG TPA: flagellar FliJ family protein [Nocardioidaceae bacterium]|nr:flagellar FliJ family protein [Nocardioidaceae bacterium]
MTAHKSHDLGLRAVARVRGVRERDSRIGLQQALVATQQREDEAAQAQARLDRSPAFVQGSSADFYAQRAALAALAAQVRRRRELAEASRANTEEAQRRWQHDRSRLRAVELLLDRRLEARRAEATRRENHELDDIAAQRWLRRRHSAPDGGDAA